ncbi:MAG TPA: tetratricopeptide repeat protein [Polyangiaceae bacterium]|nr:tetratricopeptide repeat protein [Polyangiaceae bacterium]
MRAPKTIGALLLVLAPITTRAEAAGEVEQARSIASQVASNVPEIAKRVSPSIRSRIGAAERIAAAELLLRNRDWERAIQVLSQVLELHSQGNAPEAAKADAEFLIGEAYVGSEQYLSAQRHFSEILRKAAQSPYATYVGRAASRLVDVVLRTDNTANLDELIARLEAIPSGDPTGALPYARAKAYFAKGNAEKTKDAIAQVTAGSPYYHQSLYLAGVVSMKAASAQLSAAAAAPPNAVAEKAAATASPYAAAIEQFRALVRLKADTPEHQHVIDLGWMAIARLSYETDALLDAVDAYSRVGRDSPEFSTMLYELAWVHAKLGDYQRAQRALEVLSITDPKSLRLADGALLRADLMLRSGQFEKAFELYQSVRGRFEPVHDQVSQFLKSTTDPSVFYDRLVADSLEQQSAKDLSPMIVEWARQEVESERAFVVIDDVSRSRDLVRRSRRLVAQLTGVLSSNTRSKAFPEIKGALEKALAALNRLSEARLQLAHGLDAVSASVNTPDVMRVRPERRLLMKRVTGLPLTEGDFVQREAAGESQWNAVAQRLQQLTLEADKLQAIVNGLSRVLRETEQHGIKIDAATRDRFRAEVDANQRDMEVYRQRIRQFQDAIETGRVQIGLGDSRYVEDAEVRQRFAQLLNEEVGAVASTGSSVPDAVRYANSAKDVLTQIAGIEAQLGQITASFDQQSREGAKRMLDEVARESSLIETGAQRLDELDQLARLVVGQAAMANFVEVRERLKSIVLRADVGIVQEAWEVREEQRTRVVNLQRERAREEQSLNDELREVLDDAEVSP